MNAIEDANRLFEITNGGSIDEIVNVYRTTNENLYKLFSNFSVKDKDVLSVLGSGDQVIFSYLNGAKSIETFDKELYTYYCFYLRKWLIKYKDIHFIKIDMNYKELMELVIPISQEEVDALTFWRLYFLKNDYTLDRHMFAYSNEIDLIGNLSSQKEKIKKMCDLDFKFYNMDICEKINLQKTYDILVLSNILEWVTDRRYDIVGENIEKLLNPGGIAVCTHKIGRRNDDIFNEEARQITSSKRLVLYKYKNGIGYHYRKKYDDQI